MRDMHKLTITISGPAGSGKSTLAHVVSQLLSASLPAGFEVALAPSVGTPSDIPRSLMGLAAQGAQITIKEKQKPCQLSSTPT